MSFGKLDQEFWGKEGQLTLQKGVGVRGCQRELYYGAGT